MNNSQWRVDVLLTGSWRGATAALISDGGRHFLVDTGLPHEAHQLLKALEARGRRPSDIQAVINTHFHIDHVMNNLLFPASSIYATQESYDWCRGLYSDMFHDQGWDERLLKYYPELHEQETTERYMHQLRKIALRWWNPERLGSLSQYHWIEQHGLPDGLESLVTSGHVPGHASVILRQNSQTTTIAGDALLSREHDEQILTMIPHNRRQYLLDRARILALGGRVLPGHDSEFVVAPNGDSLSNSNETGRPNEPVPTIKGEH